jgi:hypothetical protein
MSAGLPTVLALAGTALMAIAIFGPFRKPVDAVDAVAGDAESTPGSAFGTASADGAPAWPALVDATAVACDAHARIDLADALGTLRSAWAAGPTTPNPIRACDPRSLPRCRRPASRS